MANVDNSAWDASKAWANGAESDDPEAFYNGICAGKKAGDPKTQAAHALPHHYHPGDPPNAAGVRNSLSRLPQTQGLTNKAQAQSHLDAHMSVIQPASENSAGGDDGPARGGRRQARAEGAIPGGTARMHAFPGKLRATLVTRDDKQFYEVEGYASVFEVGYEMFDMFGPYREIVDYRAFDKSMANGPDVAFLVNHKGVTMARTTNGTLELSTDMTGLKAHAFLNADRQDVKDFASAIRDGLVDEMSFAFMLNDGMWNDDFDEFRILEADINRGDVSGVNFGANPYTSIQARAAEWLADAERMPTAVARAAFARLARREDIAEPGPAPDAPEFPDGTLSVELAGELSAASFGE